MKLTDRTTHALLAAFRASDPTPGGGSASALSGAVGASLLAMVAGLARPFAATPDEIDRLRAAGARCCELAARLEGLIDSDADAYDMVVGAYRLPKGTEEEKAARSARIQEALRHAIEAPLDVMRACHAAVVEASTIARLGNRNARSDVQVGLELLGAGLRGAMVNVEINLGSVKDQDHVGGVRADTQRLLGESASGSAAALALLK